MVWAYMSAKPSPSRSWTSDSWNALRRVLSGPPGVSIASAVSDSVADGTRQFREPFRQHLGRGDDLTVSQGEGATPSLAPRLDIVLVVRPCEPRGQLLRDGVEVKWRVEVVPTQYPERGQVATVLRL